MTATATSSITIPTDLYNEIKDLAASAHMSETEMIVAALQAYRYVELRKKVRSIGVVHDTGLQAQDIDEFLNQNWNPDERS